MEDRFGYGAIVRAMRPEEREEMLGLLLLRRRAPDAGAPAPSGGAATPTGVFCQAEVNGNITRN